jgi:hypothetical protein
MAESEEYIQQEEFAPEDFLHDDDQSDQGEEQWSSLM